MDRRLPLPIAGGLLLALCAGGLPWMEAVPDEALVDRIESQLAGRNCIGSLHRWARNYGFPGRVEQQDRTRVFFHFRQAGVHGRRAGRTIGRGDGLLDHRQFRTASGEYEIATGRLEINFCGWNCGADVPVGGSCG